MQQNRLLTILVACCFVFIVSCSKSNPHPEDPLEGMNREIYGFNRTVDKAVTKPIAYTYHKYVPGPLQTGVGNFFDNLKEARNVGNDLLQGKVGYAFHDASRFFVNTTVGLLGFFDVAAQLGLDPREEDFGQTLHSWGYKKSSYLVLPFLGPSTFRDTIGRGVDVAFSVTPWIGSDDWRYGLKGLEIIDTRASILRQEEVLDTIAVDEYAFVRDAYLQRRAFLSKNAGQIPVESEDPYDGYEDDDPYADFDDEPMVIE